MSQWRRKANEYLPEMREVIDDPSNDNPMALWIELQMRFSDLCDENPPNMDLIKRVWGYCSFCLNHRSGDIRTGAALGFCEHLLDNEKVASILPKLMTRQDFVDLKEVLLYHNDEGNFSYYLDSLWPLKRFRS